MNELAETFFDLYLDRLKTNKPQLLLQNRRTVMERIVELYKTGTITRNEAISRVEREAFNNVVPRFYTVNSLEPPVKFYKSLTDHSPKGLVLTDDLFTIFISNEKDKLAIETFSSWDLLEVTFEIRGNNHELSNDIRKIYLTKGYERTTLQIWYPY